MLFLLKSDNSRLKKTQIIIADIFRKGKKIINTFVSTNYEFYFPLFLFNMGNPNVPILWI